MEKVCELIVIVLVLISVIIVDCNRLKSLEESNSLVNNAQPVVRIVKDFYSTKGMCFHLVRAVESSNMDQCNDIISEVLHITSDFIATSIENFAQMEIVQKKKSSVIIFTDSLMSFEKFQSESNFTTKNYKFRRFFTIVSINHLTMSDVESMFDLFWKRYIKNVNLIMNNGNGTVNLLTYLPYLTNTNAVTLGR